MDRYIVVAGVQSSPTVWLVVDTTGGFVIAECGTSLGRAQDVASALNAAA